MSTDQKRITPEEVVEAYRKTGMKATQGSFGNRNCGCPLSAVFAAHGGDLTCECDDDAPAFDWAAQTYGNDYATGFYEGVDGAHSRAATRYGEGAADGRAAWSAVVAAGLVEQSP